MGEHDASVCQPDDLLRYIFYEHLGVKEFPEESFEKAIQREVFQITPFFTAEQEKEVLPQVTGGEFGRWHPATSFSKVNTDTKTNNCTITHAEWKKEGNLLVFTISANRFLRNMVRAIVGTLIDVGRKKITIGDFRKIIESKDRCKASTSAPACGLFLEDIKY